LGVKNSSAVATLFAVFIATAWSQSPPTCITQDKVAQALPARPRYLFRVPVFSGTEFFESNPDLADLSPPFGTIMEVFRTTDGRPLDKEAVIAFYRDVLEHNGWKEGIFRRQRDEAYLSMRTDVFENLPDGTRIQLAGDFYLWVAPRDGMMTIYLRQWRISSTDQVTHDSVQAMARRLMEAAPKAGYRAAKVSSDGKWKTDFENEYLVDRVLYALVPSDAPSSIDAPEGTLIVTLLTYRDADLAAGEKARRELEFLCTRCSAAVKGKILVTIEGDAVKEKRASVLRAITLP
jgi:hypothetical protein